MKKLPGLSVAAFHRSSIGLQPQMLTTPRELGVLTLKATVWRVDGAEWRQHSVGEGE